MKRHEPNSAVSRGKLGRPVLRGAVGLVALSALGSLAPACLDRPVAPQQPLTSRLSTKLYKNQRVDKIDLLFMIDNSASMADKQAILAEAVPDLVQRLVTPKVVNGEPEFEPIEDIHIGVITSSIGGHGSDACRERQTEHDMAHLIARNGSGGTVTTYADKGFLSWDPAQKYQPPGETSAETLKANFKSIVTGAGQDGCGFEASLEAWYRFLVDPAPYATMEPVPCDASDKGTGCRGPQGIDQLVLEQRAAFLRQDSLLAIIMLSDENDCSLIDGGQNWLALQSKDPNAPTRTFHVARGTNACQSDPWSPNCLSCWQVANNPDAYPECKDGWGADVELQEPLNLRCFQQKRRFGINFLYPIRRYVDALTDPKFADNTVNPLFCTKFPTKPDPNDPNSQIIDRSQCVDVLRDKSLVFLGGIVGLPWQDIARDGDLKKGYRPAEELNWTPERFTAEGQTPPNGLPAGATLWNMILGETDTVTTSPSYLEIKPTVDPLDPLMIESVDPRQGTHPITGAALKQPGPGLGEAPNGSEWTITKRNDLQYACTFPLNKPINCTLPENQFGCDCNVEANTNNPLCWNGSAFGTMQHSAKAYPGRRQLAVLKGVGANAIVASVCPANMTNADADDYGYRPAIAAIVDRLKSALQGTCWDQQLRPNPDGTVQCIVLEATKGETDAEGNTECAPCSGVRAEATDQSKAALATDPAFVDNGLKCVCELMQTEPGTAMQACTTENPLQSPVEGWCYVDDKYGGEKSLFAGCPADQKRLIRFVGKDVPVVGSLTYLQCRGATIGSTSSGGGAAGGGAAGAGAAGAGP
jgi:hypothetical protein